MAGKFNNRFTSKRDAMSRARKIHCCTACLHNQPEIFKVCPKCGAGNDMRVYFPSRAEHLRGVQLIMFQKYGQISNLKFHPRYDLIVEGVKICAYEADCSYIENGKQIIEDTKPEGTDFMDAVAKFKIALFNALYAKHGLSVSIYRKSN